MQILFQLPLDGMPRDELPKYIHFVVHLASWRMELQHEAELRQKVCTVKAAIAGLPGTDECTFAIGRLNLHDVIGLHASPASKLWQLADTAKGSAFTTTPKLESGRPALGSPRGARPVQIMPTLVVHVPSNLNPAFHDARISFGARTMSWLHQLMSHFDGRQLDGLKGPRVIVPLHFQVNPKLTSTHHYHHRAAPTITSALASPRRAHTLAEPPSPPQWSEGELAFPQHGATAREREPGDGWKWRSITSQPAVPPPARIPLCQVPQAYEYHPGRVDDHFALPPQAMDDASVDASVDASLEASGVGTDEQMSRATSPDSITSLAPRHHRLSEQQRPPSQVQQERPGVGVRPTSAGADGKDANAGSSLLDAEAWSWVGGDR